MNSHKHLLLTGILISLVFLARPAIAQETLPETAPEISAKLQQARQQLNQIQASLVEKRAQINAMREQMARETDAAELADLQQRIEREETDFTNLRRSFENIALGGLDVAGLDAAQQDEQFNWQQELQLILKPLFQQLKELTETPRQIDRLTNQLVLLENRQAAVQRAVANLQLLPDDNLDAATRTRLDAMLQNWTRQLTDIQREREISQLQLSLLLDEKVPIIQQVRESMNEFFTGSGLNLALSLTAFVVTLLLMKGLYLLYTKLGRRGSARMSTGRRVFIYGYQVLTMLASVMAAMLVLYIVGDILLLTLALIILIVAMLGLRNYLPRFIDETKLLLNLGAVRERERVIYEGLPWMVRSLGMYSRLFNPALEGLLRVPMSEMLELVSRPYREDEPWFPTRVNDWVMMSDGTVGQVIRQTPEMVQFRTRGSIRTYTTTNFLTGEPRNMMEGFGVLVVFGIDYQHQPISTTVVPTILRECIEMALKQAEPGKHVKDVLVEFQEAATSSLNYLVYVTMEGAAAESYYLLKRILQRACVDTCNEQGWVIPFNQLTLHLGAGSQELPVAFSPDLKPTLVPRPA